MWRGMKWSLYATGVGALAALLFFGLPQRQLAAADSQGMPGAVAPSSTRGQAKGSARCEQNASGGYLFCQYEDERGETLPFLLHVPAAYDPQQKYPLVLVLHGSGETASQRMTPTEGLALLSSQPYVTPWVANGGSHDVQSRWPSFVVVPQITQPNRWVSVPRAAGAGMNQPANVSPSAVSRLTASNASPMSAPVSRTYFCRSTRFFGSSGFAS